VKDDDYFLRSNWYADDYTIMSIELSKCNSTASANCKSDEEINEFVKDKFFEIIMTNKYFDADNYTHPVGKTLTENIYYTLFPQMTKETHIYVKNNVLELMDSFFQYGEPEKSNFYSISGGFDNYRMQKDDLYVNAYFLLQNEVTTHKRTIYSLFDMLGHLGGVFHLFYSCLYVFLYYYSEKMLQYSILRKCYQINSDAPDKMPVFDAREVEIDQIPQTPVNDERDGKYIWR